MPSGSIWYPISTYPLTDCTWHCESESLPSAHCGFVHDSLNNSQLLQYFQLAEMQSQLQNCSLVCWRTKAISNEARESININPIFCTERQNIFSFVFLSPFVVFSMPSISTSEGVCHSCWSLCFNQKAQDFPFFPFDGSAPELGGSDLVGCRKAKPHYLPPTGSLDD